MAVLHTLASARRQAEALFDSWRSNAAAISALKSGNFVAAATVAVQPQPPRGVAEAVALLAAQAFPPLLLVARTATPIPDRVPPLVPARLVLPPRFPVNSAVLVHAEWGSAGVPVAPVRWACEPKDIAPGRRFDRVGNRASHRVRGLCRIRADLGRHCLGRLRGLRLGFLRPVWVRSDRQDSAAGGRQGPMITVDRRRTELGVCTSFNAHHPGEAQIFGACLKLLRIRA
jgi:hypothetical protein